MSDSEELLASFRRYRETGDRALRNELIVAHQWVASHCARRFAHRGEPIADLIQVAQVGVLKAVERFDPEMGVSFTSFAMPTVLGELRRHFRDKTWMLRVPRRPKDLYLEVNAASEALYQRLQRTPTVDDIARELRISANEVLEAIEVGDAYRAESLDRPAQPDGPPMVPPSVDAGDAAVDDKLTIDAFLDTLAPRERKIVYLRYFEGWTQHEIGEHIGISQVHVSRLLNISLRKMRALRIPIGDESSDDVPTDGRTEPASTT